MKNIVKIIGLSIICFFTIISCEKYDVDLPKPSVSFSYSPSNPKVGDTVTFTINTNGEFLSIFTGDAGHAYETSRVKALIENDFETFYDTVYRENLSGGLPTTWYRYLKDYSSLSEVNEDFELYGAIEDVDLGVYNDFPQSLIQASYPDENVLKFTVADRRVHSGIKFKPNIHIFGKGMEPAYSQMEIRFVSSEEDKEIRRKSNVKDIATWYTVTVHDIESNTDTTASRPIFAYRTYETDDLITARTSDGFIQFGQMMESHFKYWLDNPEKGYVKEVDMRLTGQLARPGNANNTNHHYYDFNGGEYYIEELNPTTGLPVKESDYRQYKGFQGDIYLSWIEWGTKEYEPFSLGQSLGSVYESDGLQTTFKYVYTESGDFKVTVVATNTGRKQYEGDGYQTTRRFSYNDYDIKRDIYELELNVSGN
tara:strand:+ start:9642 stop:10913 length:1272 start_codon:yes stop_codon:yes gene_type:complete